MALAVALGAAIAAPPYVTAWVKAGNPVFPYFNDVFRSPHYDMKPDWADGRWRTPLSLRRGIGRDVRSSKFLEGQTARWA